MPDWIDSQSLVVPTALIRSEAECTDHIDLVY